MLPLVPCNARRFRLDQRRVLLCLTLWPEAPPEAVQERLTWAFSAVAVRPVGCRRNRCRRKVDRHRSRAGQNGGRTEDRLRGNDCDQPAGQVRQFRKEFIEAECSPLSCLQRNPGRSQCRHRIPYVADLVPAEDFFIAQLAITSPDSVFAADRIFPGEHDFHAGQLFGKPRIDLAKVRTRKEKIVSTLSGGLAQLAKRRKVQVVKARGALEPKNYKDSSLSPPVVAGRGNIGVYILNQLEVLR